MQQKYSLRVIYTREILLKSDPGRGNWQVGLLVLTWRENSLPNYAELINLNNCSSSFCAAVICIQPTPVERKIDY